MSISFRHATNLLLNLDTRARLSQRTAQVPYIVKSHDLSAQKSHAAFEHQGRLGTSFLMRGIRISCAGKTGLKPAASAVTEVIETVT